MRVVFVHGACVTDGAWWWHRTAELLAERNIASVAPALPSCGETDRPANADGPGLSDDVAAVRDVLAVSDEETVVVAHSYGGIVATDAAVGVATVRHLLFVSSYLPEVGQSLSSFGGDEPAPFLDIDPERGTFTVRANDLVRTFLHDCTAEIQQQALDKTAWQSLSILDQAVESAAWQHVASTYLVCTQDQGTPVDNQRDFARRADDVVELDTGHHPSCPSRLRCATSCSGCERNRRGASRASHANPRSVRGVQHTRRRGPAGARQRPSRLARRPRRQAARQSAGSHLLDATVGPHPHPRPRRANGQQRDGQWVGLLARSARWCAPRRVCHRSMPICAPSPHRWRSHRTDGSRLPDESNRR